MTIKYLNRVLNLCTNSASNCGCCQWFKLLLSSAVYSHSEKRQIYYSTLYVQVSLVICGDYVPEEFGLREYQNCQFRPKLCKKCVFSLVICGFLLFSVPRMVNTENNKSANKESRLYFAITRKKISINKF